MTLHKAGLCIALEPGKICWAFSGGELPEVSFVIDGFVIPQVDEIELLGVWVTMSGRAFAAVRRRIGTAWRV